MINTMWFDVLQWLLPAGTLGGIAAWIFNRRQREHSVYKDMYTDLSDEIRALSTNRREMAERIRDLEDLVLSQKQTIESLSKQIERLNIKIDTYEIQFDNGNNLLVDKLCNPTP